MSIKVTSKAPAPDPNEFVRRFNMLDGLEIVMGWPDNPEAATIAAINYFGNPAGNLPARDVITPTIQRAQKIISETMVRAAQLAANGRDPMPLVEGLEIVLTEEIKQAIREFSDPVNAPSTIAQKGFNDPLIGGGDGGRILQYAKAVVRRGN